MFGFVARCALRVARCALRVARCALRWDGWIRNPPALC
ncbi:mobA-related protein [Mycobacterium pseudoshottsii JCM 15466]|nr:mobA-related protein [Mycobacterium pseudoshottsii JCM 15466]